MDALNLKETALALRDIAERMASVTSLVNRQSKGDLSGLQFTVPALCDLWSKLDRIKREFREVVTKSGAHKAMCDAAGIKIDG